MDAAQVTLHHGDCLDVLRTLPDASVDAVVTDPPYEIAFMSRTWDSTGIAYNVDLWAECLRVLRPGGYVVAFGGTRTYHRMACAVEDAGLRIVDSLHWMHGQGFPKGKGQLKPAHEPIVLARKPAPAPWLNVDACRVVTDDNLYRPVTAGAGGSFRFHGFATIEDLRAAAERGEKCPDGRDAVATLARIERGWESTAPTGRWPANVLLSHGACDDSSCEPGCPVAELDAPIAGHDGSGASRFFPTFRYQAKAPASERPKIDGKGWPTVKPQGLMRWLVRLVTPPGGLVLDPFAGTGSTLQAARDEGLPSLGVEADEFAYLLACQRLATSEPSAPVEPLSLFDPDEQGPEEAA